MYLSSDWRSEIRLRLACGVYETVMSCVLYVGFVRLRVTRENLDAGMKILDSIHCESKLKL